MRQLLFKNLGCGGEYLIRMFEVDLCFSCNVGFVFESGMHVSQR